MARPVIKRKVGFFPENYHFTPDVSCEEGDKEIILTHGELESIRLADLLGLEQTEAARSMGISRGTYQRILNAARKKVADALVFGRIITINGGEYALNHCFAHCEECNHSWKAPCDVIFYENHGKCPECGSINIGCSDGKGKCSLGERRHQNMLNPNSRQKYQK